MSLQQKLILSALVPAVAALLFDQVQAERLRDSLRAGLLWAGSQWPPLQSSGVLPGVDGLPMEILPTVLAIGLLLLIPILWLKPH